MSHRYSRLEKEKWSAGSHKVSRRSPVRIPEADNSALIEANRISLIGRLTNPDVQRTKAVVEYMPQLWNLVGRVRGRVIGNERFQFLFDSEEDLKQVLNKAPFHYKEWMLILQAWEPIVSDRFPSSISFWVKIHDIPPHHRTCQTIRTIGKELGHVTAQDIDETKIRVDVNGLKPLEMKLEVRFSKNEIAWVELEYEKLKKHCFKCFSLSHEDRNCPSLAYKSSSNPRYMGINQRKTIHRLEAEKRRYPNLIVSLTSSSSRAKDFSDAPRRHSPRLYSSNRDHTNYDIGRVERSHLSTREQQERERSLREEGNRRSPSHRSSHRDATPNLPHRRSSLEEFRGGRGVAQGDRGDDRRDELRGSSGQSSRPPHPVSCRRSRTPLPPPPPVPKEPLLELLPAQESVIVNSNSRERRPALERLSLPNSEPTSQVNRTISFDSGRLQDVNVQYLEEPEQELFLGSSMRGHALSPRESPQSSHPRTGKNKRRQGKATGGSKPVSTRAATKRRVPIAPARARGARSPLQGPSLKKHLASRNPNPPRKRLCMATGSNLPCHKDIPGPSSSPFPPSSSGLRDVPCNSGADFLLPKTPLP